MTVNTSLPGPQVSTFAPSAGDLIHYAFSLCGIRRTELKQWHYADAQIAANMAMCDLSNRNPMRFAMQTISQTMTQGTATYVLPATVLAVSIVTIAIPSGSTAIERTIGQISAYEYAALPQKQQQGPSTSVFFNLQKIPTLTFWPTPDAGGPYTFNAQVFRNLYDVDPANLQGVDAPYRYLDALATNIAARLAESYAPEKAPSLYAKFEERLRVVLGRDQENVSLSLVPNLVSYHRIY